MRSSVSIGSRSFQHSSANSSIFRSHVASALVVVSPAALVIVACMTMQTARILAPRVSPPGAAGVSSRTATPAGIEITAWPVAIRVRAPAWRASGSAASRPSERFRPGATRAVSRCTTSVESVERRRPT